MTIYVNSEWQKHIELIQHLSQFNHNIILVTAPHLGGKTAFRQCIEKKCSPSLSVSSFVIDENEPHQDILSKIQDSLQDASSHLILIDDAHYLDDAPLKALFEFMQSQTATECAFHIVLLGEPSLELRLFGSTWNDYLQGKWYTIELEPWTLDDIRTFCSRQPLTSQLTEQDFQQILDNTIGLPGEVVEAVRQLSRKVRRTPRLVGPGSGLKRFCFHPISIGMVIGVVMGGSYLLLGGMKEIESQQVNQSLALASEDEWTKETISSPQLISKAPVYKPEGVPEPLEEDVTPEPEGRSVPLADPSKPAPVALIPPPPVLVSEPAPAPAKSMKTVPTQPSSSKVHYTLQLIAANDKKNANQFIAKHGIGDKAKTYRTQREGKAWYVVVYGDYPSKEKAQVAASSIPDSLKKENITPWVRNLESIESRSKA